jgi:hypothetical protein
MLRRRQWLSKSLCPVLDVGVARLTLCEFNEGCSLERAYPQAQGGEPWSSIENFSSVLMSPN